VKGDGLIGPYRERSRRGRDEQADTRWDLDLVGLVGLVVSVGLVDAATEGAEAVRVPPDEEPHPASKAAATKTVIESLKAL
jgi:hypothetical protein